MHNWSIFAVGKRNEERGRVSYGLLLSTHVKLSFCDSTNVGCRQNSSSPKLHTHKHTHDITQETHRKKTKNGLLMFLEKKQEIENTLPICCFCSRNWNVLATVVEEWVRAESRVSLQVRASVHFSPYGCDCLTHCCIGDSARLKKNPHKYIQQCVTFLENVFID